MITKEELDNAQITIFKWFMAQREEIPVTLLDSTMIMADTKFRLITHVSLIGKEE